ncbi:MAG: S24/S26 family peptidase [Acidimicrobiales bacterium]
MSLVQTRPFPSRTKLTPPLAGGFVGRPGPVARRRLAATIASVVVLALAWLWLAPQQLGGSDAYSVTDGVSMLPRIHAGDLVVVRREASYHVGEVAAFHDLQLHAVVLHRIIAIHGGRYVFKGDNNDFVTSYEPTKAQIVGAERLHVPGAGKLILDLRTPAVAAALLALLWLFSFSPSSRSRRQRRRGRHAR